MACNDAAIGVSDEDDVAWVLQHHEIGHIRDMGVEADVAAQEMGAFSDTGQRRREHPVRACRQQVTHARPTPAAMPRAVDYDVVGHFGDFLVEVGAIGRGALNVTQ